MGAFIHHRVLKQFSTPATSLSFFELKELPDLSDGCFGSHVMLGSESLRVLVLLLVLEAFDLLLDDLLNSHDVLVAFLIDQLVHLLQQALFDVRLLLLVDNSRGLRWEGLFVGHTRILRLKLLNVVQDHKAKGKGV
jgi:hypothetical protein